MATGTLDAFFFSFHNRNELMTFTCIYLTVLSAGTMTFYVCIYTICPTVLTSHSTFIIFHIYYIYLVGIYASSFSIALERSGIDVGFGAPGYKQPSSSSQTCSVRLRLWLCAEYSSSSSRTLTKPALRGIVMLQHVCAF